LQLALTYLFTAPAFTEENKPEQLHAQIVVHKAEKEGGLNVIVITGEIGPPDGPAFLIKIFGSL
jgi:hypothetical protein